VRALPYGWRRGRSGSLMLASCVQLGCFTWASTRRRSLCSISTAAWGVTSPLRQAYLQPVVPSQQRATRSS